MYSSLPLFHNSIRIPETYQPSYYQTSSSTLHSQRLPHNHETERASEVLGRPLVAQGLSSKAVRLVCLSADPPHSRPRNSNPYTKVFPQEYEANGVEGGA